ncbi:uncharacterized protein BO80DRAFT_424858 [Aspergillus ibericus CBS 121593]|uniref:Uncharacterized protein n=1 Tax=Aspergillus ibericus CBS 121593 TaxID=1448316 RepID=A0A395H113_9EURO|nr:hypothetical protein BO80DRAFT_424858 [Aspergillus ibericus CBS 121593]RAL01303.1 hypothetical protein BO80DRAFT_424858 [Aspergillus ibericus CBS 121593]
MSFRRVIQDSDDEDDPLAGPPSPRPNGDNRHVDVQKDSGHVHFQQTGHDSHMSVNFDQFLQSQDSAHQGVSSSQQRREERWIPADAGGGSIGSMMTEIGLAQQRLFDDEEAHYTGQTGYQEAVAMGVHEQIASEFPAPNDIALVNNDDPDNYTEQPPIYTVPQPNVPDYPLQYEPRQDLPLADETRLSTHTPTAQNNEHTSSNYSISTGASYNIYPTGTVQTEIAYKSPRRHNSDQPTPFSPHDTEPFSSVRSSRVSRTMSENAAQQYHQGADELAGPVTIEISVVEKKRGRKKKQSLPDNDDDDELAHHYSPTINQDATATTTTNNTNKPERRKPGRPPKNAKPPREEEDCGPISEANAAIPIPPDTTSTNPLAPTEHNQTPIPIDPPPQDTREPPQKPPKEPKKKKLKRGKTTSITLTKTYDPDVEDDVIWIDERPVLPTTHDHEPTTTDNANPPAQEEDSPILPDPAPAPAAAAPKKRGRKRKNPIEEPPINQSATEASAEPPNQHPQLQSDKENTLTEESPSEPQAQPESEPEPQPETEPEQHHQQEEQTPDPHQQPAPTTPLKPSKGPKQHSPISSTSKVPYRVGLSRRARIAPLLKIVKR